MEPRKISPRIHAQARTRIEYKSASAARVNILLLLSIR